MGAKLMQAQAAVGTVVAVVVAGLVDGKGNLGWWRRTPRRSEHR